MARLLADFLIFLPIFSVIPAPASLRKGEDEGLTVVYPLVNKTLWYI